MSSRQDALDTRSRAEAVPVCLRHGDTVAVISTSSPAAAEYPRRLNRGIAALESCGLKVVRGRSTYVKSAHTAGSAAERASDLHWAYASEQVRAILCSIGGANTNQLLEYVDYDLIRTHRKIFVGFSDVSCLLLTIWSKTGYGPMLGPAVMSQFAEPGGVHPFTRKAFMRATMTSTPLGRLQHPSLARYGFQYWELDDEAARPLIRMGRPVSLRDGEAEGPVVALNIGALCCLVGTRHCPQLGDHVLLLEDDESETTASIDRMLTHLAQAGMFRGVRALGFGRFDLRTGITLGSLAAIVNRVIPDDIPICANLALGHVDPMLTIPFGVNCQLTAGARCSLTIKTAASRTRLRCSVPTRR